MKEIHYSFQEFKKRAKIDDNNPVFYDVEKESIAGTHGAFFDFTFTLYAHAIEGDHIVMFETGARLNWAKPKHKKFIEQCLEKFAHPLKAILGRLEQ